MSEDVEEQITALMTQAAHIPPGIKQGDVLKALLQAIRDYFIFISKVGYDQRRVHFVEQAQGIELDRLGRILGIGREEEETDDTFRARLLVYVNDHSKRNNLEAIQHVVEWITGWEPVIGTDLVEAEDVPQNYFQERIGHGYDWPVFELRVPSTYESDMPTIEVHVNRVKSAGVVALVTVFGETLEFITAVSLSDVLAISGFREHVEWWVPYGYGFDVGVFDDAQFDDASGAIGIDELLIDFGFTESFPIDTGGDVFSGVIEGGLAEQIVALELFVALSDIGAAFSEELLVLVTEESMTGELAAGSPLLDESLDTYSDVISGGIGGELTETLDTYTDDLDTLEASFITETIPIVPGGFDSDTFSPNPGDGSDLVTAQFDGSVMTDSFKIKSSSWRFGQPWAKFGQIYFGGSVVW